MSNKKSKPILTLALGAALTLTGLFATANQSHAASLSEAEKVNLETAYIENSISNRASKMLLTKAPQATAKIKGDLNKLIKESDALLVESKPLMDSLRPERENESEEIKNLDQAYFTNKVSQEAIYMLFERTPKSVESVKGSLTDELNTAVKSSSEAEVLLNKLRGYKQITIVHVNDTHGRAKEDDKAGELGFAKLQTFFNYKNQANNAILLNAGDVLHGTTFATISRGESMVDVMNEMSWTAMTAGNHDFNYGWQELVELNKRANFPILASNVVDQNGQNILDAGRIIEVDGVKIGLFGIATEETKTKSAPVNTEGLTFVTSVIAARNEVAKLKEEGAEIIVCLSHLGDNPASKETSIGLASLVEGIDVVIDGHSHSRLENGMMLNDVLVAQAWEHGKDVGEVTLLLDKDNKIVSKTAKLNPYSRTQYLVADSKVAEKIDAISSENDKVLQEVVGNTTVDLDGARADVRTRETNLGNFVTDAMIEATGAQIALTNGGGIRDSIAAGEIKRDDVLTVFPFTNFAVTIEVTGQEVKEALEHGLTDLPEQAGKFPHIAGMQVKFDSSKPAGSRVTEIIVDGAAMDMNKTYTMVTNDFLTTGGDGYEMLNHPRTGEFELVSEIFEQAIRKAGTISPEVDGRLEDVNKAKAADKAA